MPGFMALNFLIFLKLLFSGLNVFYELFKTLPKIPKVPNIINVMDNNCNCMIELQYVCNCEGATYILTYVHDCLNLLYMQQF